jgi:hypothetical protein
MLDARSLPADEPGTVRPAVRLAYFVTFLSAGVWLPYMPLYLASLGLDGARIGILGAWRPGCGG